VGGGGGRRRVERGGWRAQWGSDGLMRLVHRIKKNRGGVEHADRVIVAGF